MTIECMPSDQPDRGRLQRHLATLPEPPLPEALWGRVAHARRRQVARRRLAIGGGVAVALALAVLPAQLPGPAVTADEQAAIAVAAHAPPPRVAAGSDPAARLRTLDRELQAAYHRGSDEAEIAQLWEARAALLGDRVPATPVRPVRI